MLNSNQEWKGEWKGEVGQEKKEDYWVKQEYHVHYNTGACAALLASTDSSTEGGTAEAGTTDPMAAGHTAKQETVGQFLPPIFPF